MALRSFRIARSDTPTSSAVCLTVSHGEDAGAVPRRASSGTGAEPVAEPATAARAAARASSAPTARSTPARTSTSSGTARPLSRNVRMPAATTGANAAASVGVSPTATFRTTTATRSRAERLRAILRPEIARAYVRACIRSRLAGSGKRGRGVVELVRSAVSGCDAVSLAGGPAADDGSAEHRSAARGVPAHHVKPAPMRADFDHGVTHGRRRARPGGDAACPASCTAIAGFV